MNLIDLFGYYPRPVRLNRVEEAQFQRWYAAHARMNGLNPDPDDPLHYYDYRAAFKAGVTPGPSKHWPSVYKDLMHPNRFVQGTDTRQE